MSLPSRASEGREDGGVETPIVTLCVPGREACEWGLPAHFHHGLSGGPLSPLLLPVLLQTAPPASISLPARSQALGVCSSQGCLGVALTEQDRATHLRGDGPVAADVQVPLGTGQTGPDLRSLSLWAVRTGRARGLLGGVEQRGTPLVHKGLVN